MRIWGPVWFPKWIPKRSPNGERQESENGALAAAKSLPRSVEASWLQRGQKCGDVLAAAKSVPKGVEAVWLQREGFRKAWRWFGCNDDFYQISNLRLQVSGLGFQTFGLRQISDLGSGFRV